ncbi:hypothetical protein RUND412_002259 [Rhizina undulata]
MHTYLLPGVPITGLHRRRQHAGLPLPDMSSPREIHAKEPGDLIEYRATYGIEVPADRREEIKNAGDFNVGRLFGGSGHTCFGTASLSLIDGNGEVELEEVPDEQVNQRLREIIAGRGTVRRRRRSRSMRRGINYFGR